MSSQRLPYVDWLRGLAVIVMIEAHVFDAWMRLPDRSLPQFTYARILGGWAAPAFLFLAGLSLTLSMERRRAAGASMAEVTRAGFGSGWRVLGYAFLVRTPSFLATGRLASLLKVDILNIMGLAMLAAVGLWRAATRPWLRAALLVAAAAGLSLATPFLRLAPWPALLPDALEAYLRPVPGKTSFSLFPWPGFVLAGAVAGVFMATLDGAERERRVMRWFGGAGAVACVAAFGLSLGPSPYADSRFWTSSPSFFLLRCGAQFVALAVAWQIAPWLSGTATRLRRVLTTMGTASFFVYWVHVELIYGVLGRPLRHRLTFSQTVLVYVAAVAAMYGLTRLKGRIQARWAGGRRFGPASAAVSGPSV